MFSLGFLQYYWCFTFLLTLFGIVAGLSSDGSGSGEIFDFIVVGGGTAGCCVASRLAESGKFNVLLLEIGSVPHSGLDIPAIAPRYLTESARVYRSVPQNTLGLGNNRVIDYAIGRGLGGTSQINGMFVNRGSPHDYDNWALVTGDQSWTYSNMLKYLKKFENYSGDFPSSQHGYDGPITVTRPDYSPGLMEWMEGGSYLGYPVADPNGPQKISFAPVEFSKRFGRRVSSYTGYIKPILSTHSNLKIITNADVRRVLFDGDTAVGVLYSSDSQQVIARARKEIILSAGVFNSPAILMRSGLGPLDVLHAAGIPPVKILPVGKNLQDHLAVRLDFIVNDTSTALIPERDLTMENFLLYNQIGDGPYSSTVGMHAQAFIASSKSVKNGISSWPDTHLLSLHYATRANLSGNPDWEEFWQLYLASVKKSQTTIAVLPLLTRPKSTGRVTLNATNVDADPVIDFQYLSHPDDIQATLEAVKLAMKLFEETPAFNKIGARFPRIPYPACRRLKYRSDDYWRCYIRHVGNTAVHAGGTCRMGKGSDDPKAVVDSHLRVIGIKNLIVADASVMADVTNANTQAPIYAIAEKTSEMILRNWETTSQFSSMKKLMRAKHL